MTIQNKFLYAAMLMLGITACNSNEPWAEQDAWKGQKGTLMLDLSAKKPEKVTRAAVPTEGFYVTISGKDEAMKDYSKRYTFGDDLTPNTVLELPVGLYDVKVNSLAMDCPKQYAYPVYGGTKEVEITHTATTQTTVTCKMVNSRITVKYSEEFLQAFTAWEVSITDGGSKALTYNENDKQPKDIYWLFDNQVKEVRVNVRAVTKEGISIEAENVYNKHNSVEQYTDIDSEYFGGGDALEFNFKPATNPNGYITGVTIQTKIDFTNEDQDVIIEVVDNGNNGNNGDDDNDDDDSNDITITSNPANGIVNANFGQTSDFPAVQYDFAFPTGLEHIYVKVSSDNDGFVFATSLMGLTEGDGLDLASEAATSLAELFPLPVVGSKTYQFSLTNAIWALLANEPGYVGSHVFTLKAVDKNGKTKAGQLTINVTE